MSSKVRKKACAYCGQEFTAKRCDARYCSSRCRSAVYRQRKRVEKLTQEALALLAEVEFHAHDREIESSAVEQLKLVQMRVSQALNRVGGLAVALP